VAIGNYAAAAIGAAALIAMGASMVGSIISGIGQGGEK
jgi:hypothetical protein